MRKALIRRMSSIDRPEVTLIEYGSTNTLIDAINTWFMANYPQDSVATCYHGKIQITGDRNDWKVYELTWGGDIEEPDTNSVFVEVLVLEEGAPIKSVSHNGAVYAVDVFLDRFGKELH